MKYCSNHPDRRVFARGFCLQCYRSEYLLKKQREKPKKVYKIKPYSAKRVILNKEYDNRKKENNRKLIAEGKFKCFFTGVQFDLKFNPDYHHCIGRDGDLLTDMDYAFPCYFEPHRQYHDLKYDKKHLDACSWYWSWLERIKTELPLLYWKEKNKIDKANMKIQKYG